MRVHMHLYWKLSSRSRAFFHIWDSYLKERMEKGQFPCNFSSSECHPSVDFLNENLLQWRQIEEGYYPLRYYVTFTQVGQKSWEMTPATGMISERISSKRGGKGCPRCLQDGEKTYPHPQRLKKAVVRKWASRNPNETAIDGVAIILSSSKAHAFIFVS